MKILLITLDFPPKTGGVAAYLENIAKFFNKKITVFAPLHKKSEYFDSRQSFKIYREKFLFSSPSHLPLLLGGGGLRWGKAAFFIRKIYKKEKAEILAVNDVLPLGYAALVLKIVFKIPYFVFLHGLDFNLAKRNFWKKFWLGKILKNADFIVVNSEYLKNEVNKFISGMKIEVIYPSIGGFAVPNPELKEKIINKYNLGGKSVIFSLGRLVKRKGFDNLILAFRKIREEMKETALLIAGSGPEKKNLKTLAAGGDNTFLLGKISDEEKIVLYDLCDVFAMMPRDSGGDIEGFGIVYLEAAYFGKPSVASRVGGVSEAVLNGETGVLVDGENAEEISQAIIKLLKDDDLRREMGERARKRVLEEFTAEKQVSKIIF